MIRLFADDAKEFTTNGIGPLPNVMEAYVEEELNGPFELIMTYPVDGKRFTDIHNRSILVCKPNPFDPPQAFRVYSMTKPMNGLVTINAAHISYDLNGIPIGPFRAETAAGALAQLKTAAAVDCPFEFWTDKETKATMNTTVPYSIRAVLAGQEGSILDIYGGQYKWDNYTVRLYNNRGADRGVLIAYGKNLTDIEQEENCSNVYTGVYPYYYNEQDGGLLELPEKIVNAEGTFDHVNISTLDLSSNFDERPGYEALREEAKRYMKDNKIGIPKISIDISFIQLSQSKEYELYGLLDQVQLGDTVTVRFEKLGIDVKSECVSYKYNVLTDRYDTLTLGEPQANLSTAISDQNQSVKEDMQSSRSFLQEAIDRSTKAITGGLGGYVVIHSSTGGTEPDEILIMDTPDIKTARKVWRWNKGGLGYSENGYEGPFETAITQDGEIVADFITVGTLTANLIKAGVLQSLDGETFYLDLEGGILRMNATELRISGKTPFDISTEVLNTWIEESYNDFEQTVGKNLESLQQQTDKKAENWYQSEDPAKGWNAEEKPNHVNDYWYNTETQQTYMYDGSDWVETTSNPPDIVFDRIDGKSSTFVDQPTVPYYIGDQWYTGGTAGVGEVKICIFTRKTGYFDASDWQKLDEYINENSANILTQKILDDWIDQTYTAFVETTGKNISALQEQADKKAENWYQADEPGTSWTADEKKEHTNDYWYNTKDRKVYIYNGSAWVEADIMPPDMVFDEIDGKSSTYVSQPDPPYYEGDQWYTGGTAGVGTVKVCVRTRETGVYTESDWKKLDEYINEGTATSVSQQTLQKWVDETYKAFADSTGKSLTELESQVDQKAENWYQATAPGTNWTEDEKAAHKNDYWFNTTDQKTYMYDGSKWIETTAMPPDFVFDEIDGKSSTFVSKPKPPYYEGDQWYTGGKAGTGSVSVCVNTREEGEFVASDWKKLDEYINQAAAASAAQNAVDSQTQMSIFNKLTNGGKEQGIYIDPDTGLLMINGSYMRIGKIQNPTLTTTYDLINAIIQMGADSSNHVYMDDKSILWYVVKPDGKPGNTGIFYSVYGYTWIGARSRYTYFGWIGGNSNGLPVAGNESHWRGVGVDYNTESDSRVWTNTVTFDVTGSSGLGVSQGVRCNTLTVWTDGGKNGVVHTDYGDIYLTATESPAPCFHDWGGGKCDEEGICQVVLDERFLESIEPKQRKRWMITDTCGDGHLWVEDTETGGIVHGAPWQTFDWVVFGSQRGTGGWYAERCEEKNPGLNFETPDILWSALNDVETDDNKLESLLWEVPE